MAIQNQLQQAAELLKNGQRVETRAILDRLVNEDPNNQQVWNLLFCAVDHPQEKCDCLKQAVRINPQDALARQKLKKYRASPVFPGCPAAGVIVPAKT